MAKKKARLGKHTESDTENVNQWILNNQTIIPDFVLKALTNYQIISDELKKSQSKRSTLLVELRRALGITPSSERKNLRSEKNQDDKKASLVQSLEYHKERKDWHSKQIKKHKIMEKDIEKKIKSIDEIELSQEDLDEIKAQREKEEVLLKSGGEADPSLLTPKEALMNGLEAQIIEEDIDFLLPALEDGEEYKNTFLEDRTRYDFDFQLAKLNLHIEKGQDSLGNMRSASTRDLGPKGFQVTWGFLANITLLSTQYAIPFERLARLTSTKEKKFSSSHMCRFFSYVAGRLLPIYLHLWKNLSKSDLISGDDTVVRVIEANKALEENKQPWNHYSTQEIAEQTLGKPPDLLELGPKLAEELGFEFQRKTGDGPKKQLKTTVILGKETSDPQSHIVFYRTHFGNFGNLLDLLLLERSQKKTQLFIQSDLSTVNLVSEVLVLEKFNISLFGCASHARRPFALHEKDDPACAHVLSLFRMIYCIESGLNIYGRNKTNVLEMRKQAALPHWEEILRLCHQLTTRWSSATAIGIGARYVIKHYGKLTAYIYTPIVPLTNNLCERMLRMEKIIQVNSLFRNSLEGRFALDISRTIVQTAVAAGVDVKQYLLHVLKEKNLQQNPAGFTPFAFSKKAQD